MRGSMHRGTPGCVPVSLYIASDVDVCDGLRRLTGYGYDFRLLYYHGRNNWMGGHLLWSFDIRYES